MRPNVSRDWGSDMLWAYLQTIIALLIVLLLMAGMAYLLRRWVLGQQIKGSALINIDVLAAKVIQPKYVVYVIRVQEKTLVVGVSNAGFQLLTEIETKGHDELSDGSGTTTVHEGNPSFLEFLKKNIGIIQPGSKRKS